MIADRAQFAAVRRGMTPQAIGHISAMTFAFLDLEDVANFDCAANI